MPTRLASFPDETPYLTIDRSKLAYSISLLALAAALLASACSRDSPNSGPEIKAMTAAPEQQDSQDDPRLWLEEVEGTAALEWVRGENARAAARLEEDPRFGQFVADALAVYQSPERIPYGSVRGDHVYNFWEDADHPHGIWRRASLDSYLDDSPAWEALLDLGALAAEEGTNWVWGGADCAPQPASRCIIRLSDGGKDAGVFREFDLDAKAFVADGFTTPEAKGGTAWVDADTLLVWLSLDSSEVTESGYPFVIRRWCRDTPLASAVEVMRGSATDVGVSAWRLEGTDGEVHLVGVRRPSFFEATYFLLGDLLGGHSAPVTLPLPARASPNGLFAGQLVLSIFEDWTPSTSAEATHAAGSVLSFDLDAFRESGQVPPIRTLVTPTSRQSVRAVGVSASAVLIAVDENVTGSLQAFRLTDEGWRGHSVATPENLTLSLFATDPAHDLGFLAVEGFLTPPSLYLVNAATDTARLVTASPEWFDSSGLEVQQHEVRSADGTRVPYFLVSRADAPNDGDTPVALYGYGGFQVSSTPAYSGVRGRLWLERGGAFAVANIRGGGEFGPAWHQAGLKTNRQRIYDDMIAVAEDLIGRGVTRPSRLAVDGRSNGGLLSGVMYTQRPDLWGAVISGVPLLDMLRYHLLPAGASWVGEYGHPDDPEEGAFLRSISPYHNVEGDIEYPEIYLYTSTKDDRVHPGHARKFAHLLGELGHPYVYFENIEGGHAGAANRTELARRDAMLHVFMTQRLMEEANGSTSD